MKVISTDIGFVLAFSSLKELISIIDHLNGLAEWVEAESITPPLLYAIYDSRIGSDDQQQLLDYLKEHLV